MIEDFFDHVCNIYFPVTDTDPMEYDVPARKTTQYPATPSLAAVPCHFSVRSQSQSFEQSAPINTKRYDGKLTLPAGTAIPQNCKIVDVTPGSISEEYTGKRPLNIRGHHVTVELYLRTEQEPM